MIYTIEDLGSNSLFIEKRTNEDNIVHGWAVLRFTKNGCDYSDSSKVKKVLTNCAEIVNYFDNCTTKNDEVSDTKHPDAECYDIVDFESKLDKFGYKIIKNVINKNIPTINAEIDNLEEQLEELKNKRNDLQSLELIW